MYAFLFSFLFLIVGTLAGWLLCEKYVTYMQLMLAEPHEYEELFENNPHPELFDAEGNINRGEYWVVNIPPDFDPEKDTFYLEDPDSDDEW